MDLFFTKIDFFGGMKIILSEKCDGFSLVLEFFAVKILARCHPSIPLNDVVLSCYSTVPNKRLNFRKRCTKFMKISVNIVQ